MEEIYPVRLGDAIVGKVKLQAQGLYFNVSCICQLPDNKLYRLHARSNRGTTDLGILVPERGQYVRNTSIPTKRIICAENAFFIVSPDAQHEDTGIAIKTGGVFSQLSELEDLHLEKRGRVWAAVRNTQSQPSLEKE